MGRIAEGALPETFSVAFKEPWPRDFIFLFFSIFLFPFSLDRHDSMVSRILWSGSCARTSAFRPERELAPESIPEARRNLQTNGVQLGKTELRPPVQLCVFDPPAENRVSGKSRGGNDRGYRRRGT
jgi:hypothetical protein